MKVLSVLFLSLGFLFLSNPAQSCESNKVCKCNAKTKAKTVKQIKKTKAQLGITQSSPLPSPTEKVFHVKIQGMLCGGCVAKAQNVFKSFKAVRIAQVDLESGIATVVASKKADPKPWIKALTDVKKKNGKSHGWKASLVN